jgi:SpoVK/Ycf46/Vps4 family AAA+-type ATPase
LSKSLLLIVANVYPGKTTVARLWAKFLVSLAVIPGSTFKETTGSKLASDGVKGCEAILEDIKNSGGGVLFIDEAYQLSSGNSPGGKSVLDFLLAEVENLRGKVVFVLAGYSKQMESFFSHNPGFPSRFPIEMKFEDYDDKQLLDIFRLQLHKKFHSRMKIEGGSTGLYARIATRRVGYSRGKEGFGNARAVENCMATICKRQATRLQKERQSKGNPDDFLMTKEDMIGPEPSDGLKTSKGWNNLQGLIGLKEVKETVKVLLDTIQTNYERELAEEPLVQLSLNKVFLGSPGTGKTTVAKFYGQILVDLGLLSNGEVVVKNPADFIGAHLGESEANTKGILAATVGKVLVIDEAYGLYGGGGAAGGGAERDFFKTSVIDTIVAEVQSVPGDDRCVLLLGYQDKMETMFQNVNPGLSRRFPMDSAFVFVDFDDEALGQILDSKLKSSGFKATEKAKAVAIEVLRRARNRPNFGNAGEIDNLLGTAKISLQKRVSSGKAVQKGLFEAVDFDPDFDRADRANTNVRKLFESEVGRESVIKLLEGYQKRVRDCKELDIDPEIPFNFLFRGPPGTGKTSTARKIGKVFYDMGFLASAKVDECSASDFVGEYIGHTGPKVRRRVEKALGRVLLIDEAYRLGKGQFGKEALDELVDLTTKPEFKNKLIIILAGYAKDINSLMTRNPGMTSRFPEVIDFHPLDPGACVELMVALLKKMEKILAGKGRIFDITCLTNTNNGFPEVLKTKFSALSRQDGWASGRDVENLTKSISRALDISSQTIELSSRDVITCIDNLFRERQERMENKLDEDPFSRLKQAPAEGKAPQMKTSTSTTTVKKTSPEEKTEAEPVIEPPKVSSKLGKRDVGVSDEVWEQLQRDAAEEDRKAEELRELKRKEQSASDADRERVVRQIIEGEERAKQEAAMKQKLMALGVCPMGWEWIKQNGGYRCAGGSHYMSDGDVGRL